MQNRYLTLPLAAAASLLLAACSSTPEPNANLEQARSQYQILRSTPDANTLAAVELEDAEQAISAADAAVNQRMDPEIIGHRAYLAKQRVGIAQETLNLKKADAQLENIDAQRTEARLDIRTRQAQSAEMRAEQAQQQVQSMAQELQDLKARQTDRGTVITLGDVLFDTAKSDLKTGGLRNVRQLADYLRDNPERKVLVEGFTDSVGSEEYNQGLSERRANSVRDALVDMGIDTDRIRTRGYGEDYPVAGNDSAASRQMNRRVEVIIGDDDSDVQAR